MYVLRSTEYIVCDLYYDYYGALTFYYSMLVL